MGVWRVYERAIKPPKGGGKRVQGLIQRFGPKPLAGWVAINRKSFQGAAVPFLTFGRPWAMRLEFGRKLWMGLVSTHVYLSTRQMGSPNRFRHTLPDICGDEEE